MIVTRTPVRISLGGGGTDLLPYASRFGGFLISGAIDKYIFVTVNRRKLDNLIRVSYSRTEIVEKIDQIQHPIIREALKLTQFDGGVEINTVADVPANSGLGTSGSFTVGLLNALHALGGEHLSKQELAEEACRIEIDILKEPIGKHDQYLGAFGGITCLEIGKNGNASAYPVSMSDDLIDELERCIMLFYTGLTRRSSDILGDVNRAGEDRDERVLDSLHRIKKIGYEIKGAFETGNVRRFGELLDIHWQAKKAMSEKISGNQIDKWYEIARDNGALGGKIMGAGGGGFFMFYCNDADRARLRSAMTEEGLVEMRFKFDFEGSKVMVNF